jgi:uncharacterized protein (TIGR01777 family)
MNKVLIAGASGFIGSALKDFLERNSFEVSTLVRRSPEKKFEIYWSPEKSQIELSQLEGFDFIVNLCGENIANRRWTKSYKQKLLKSRIQTTNLLAQSIQQLQAPPKKFLCASAIGIYGSKANNSLEFKEDSNLGHDYLAEICKAWEEVAEQAKRPETNVICLRFAAVLAQSGGMLNKIIPAFRLGAGAILGNGTQNFSWIALSDLLRAIHFLFSAAITGPVNLSSPMPTTNRDFSYTLARYYNRPCFIKLPEPFLKLFFGKEFAEQVLLADQKVQPYKLLEAGFKFELPTIKAALESQRQS